MRWAVRAFRTLRYGWVVDVAVAPVVVVVAPSTDVDAVVLVESYWVVVVVSPSVKAGAVVLVVVVEPVSDVELCVGSSSSPRCSARSSGTTPASPRGADRTAAE